MMPNLMNSLRRLCLSRLSRTVALAAIAFFFLSNPANATSVHCYTGEQAGQTWDDPRTMEELLAIGATELCNGGGIRHGSRITDEQRQVLNTIIVTTIVVARKRK